ncbi:terminase gpA endonuclease subunit [Poseidonibacter lekithochrous]|uniref:terminase gpA endonuclease subunit n=1 Tax=Poseidonibacter lekithochrous TaxID=1904463 RepID=UPI000D368E8B|nr:terminase gpA endonuclease subunit [Poseidonibacter lekithochrous]
MNNGTFEYKMPQNVVFLTCGVDVMDDSLEGEVKAWDEKEHCFGLFIFRIEGSPGQNKVWCKLGNIISSFYETEDNDKIKISCTCIDSGGHFTDEVYKFCKEREHNNVYAVKGKTESRKTLISSVNTSNKANIKLFMINSDIAKELIFEKLKNGEMHFFNFYSNEYFLQLRGEKRIETSTVTRWRAIRAQRQALDYTVNNFVAYEIVKPKQRMVLK